MVHRCQKTGKCAGGSVRKVADEISDEDAEDFAATKHDGLPEKKESRIPDFFEWLSVNGLGVPCGCARCDCR